MSSPHFKLRPTGCRYGRQATDPSGDWSRVAIKRFMRTERPSEGETSWETQIDFDIFDGFWDQVRSVRREM